MSIAEVAATYAPLVVLHAEDKLKPSSAEWFLQHSSLRWANGRGLDGEAVPDADGGVDASRLGSAGSNPYRHGKFVASALTRPLDDNAARGHDPPPGEGFFLRLKDAKSARGDKGSTVYWDYEPDVKALTYWLFYPGSGLPLGILRAGEQIGTRGMPTQEAPTELEAADAAAKLEEFTRAYPGLAIEAGVQTRGFGGDVIQTLKVVGEGVRTLLSDDGVLHEGDWERITVYLDTNDPENAPPTAVAYYRHATNTFKKWESVDRHEETHPFVFSAIGSHASLPTPGFGWIDIGDPDGPEWRTWEDLVPVAEQPWYGFGGAWGRLGKVRDATGPLGPGDHWKHAAPRPADSG